MEIRLIGEEDYITTEWSGGKTTQLYIYPEDSNYKALNFKFRLSSATVESEKSEFTKLEGVDRFITPLDNDLKLTHYHNNYVRLKPLEVYRFDGGEDTVSYGIARDFNLMLRAGAEGNLESIHIDKELLLSEDVCAGCKECFYFIYACDKDVRIEIARETIIVGRAQMLCIRITAESVLNLKISCEGTSDILVAEIHI